MFRIRIVLIIVLVAFISCNSSNKIDEKKEEIKKTEETKKPQRASFKPYMGSIFTIKSYDGKRELETGKGFAVAADFIVAPLSIINSATNIKLFPLNGDASFPCDKYVAIDRINNLVLLKIEEKELKPLKLYINSKLLNVITYTVGKQQGNTIPVTRGKCLGEEYIEGQKVRRVTNTIQTFNQGNPLLVSTGSVMGMGTSKVVIAERIDYAIPASEILKLLKKKSEPVKTLQSLKTFHNQKASEENKKIKGVVLETDKGNITIRLFNSTPTYRDNFIRLVKEGYYDSLLVHRVIRDFGIQMGAADARYAEKGDVVGWKGPGYTIPAHIVKGLYHKRGMIGSPRKPDTKNAKFRSDGSQFYIVTGRKYLDDELDELEEKNSYKFSAQQREVYKTIGGAPHLDGTYTVFGEVISGLEIADFIEKVPTDTYYRPFVDIRLKQITILK